MFNTLRSYFRTRRALLDTIAEQNDAWDKLAAENQLVAGSNENLARLLDAANAQLAKVTAEANANLERIQAQAVTIANLSRSAEQGELDRQSLAAERNTAIGDRDHWIAESKSAHQRRVAAEKERDEAAKKRDYWKARDAAWMTENDGVRKERDAAVKTGELVEAKARHAYYHVFKANAILAEIGVPEDTVDAPAYVYPDNPNGLPEA
jgi:multidrug efflux pump subunit AcrA (membrane-fusion protein)